MSKAFVRESDEEEDRPEEPQALPVGFKNYMTPHGHRQLQEELRTLLRVERPKVVDVVSWAAGNGDRSENGDYISMYAIASPMETSSIECAARSRASRGIV